MDRSSKQNINKETLDLKYTLDQTDQTDLADIHRTFHQIAAEYTFFSSIRGTFSKIDHMLIDHKTSLSKF